MFNDGFRADLLNVVFIESGNQVFGLMSSTLAWCLVWLLADFRSDAFV